MRKDKVLLSLLALTIATLNCNMPADQTVTESPGTVTVVFTPILGEPSITPVSQPASTIVGLTAPTACQATVRANSSINVRMGPSTDYPAIDALDTGVTAMVIGKNADGTWWNINRPSGGTGWVAGSVTTALCIPDALQIVAAPPLPPTAVPPTDVPPTAVPPVVGKPDLYVSEYTWSPVPPHMANSFHVRIGVYNQGNGKADDAFTVEWWLSTTAPAPACTWPVASLVAHGGRILECDYTPGGWANYPSQVVVDSDGTVVESDEGNNTWSQTLQISP
jgi:hypothetical protein